MFKNILLPTDGSNLSQVAIQKGVQLAKSIKAKITGISVMPEQKYYLYQTDIIVQVREETVKQHNLQAHRNLSAIEKAAQEAGVPCEMVREISDHPYETIIRAAEKRGGHDHDGVSRSEGRKGPAARQRNPESANPLRDPSAGLSLRVGEARKVLCHQNQGTEILRVGKRNRDY
jgi:nucleotide-binding universal stress UspA family protein